MKSKTEKELVGGKAKKELIDGKAKKELIDDKAKKELIDDKAKKELLNIIEIEADKDKDTYICHDIYEVLNDVDNSNILEEFAKYEQTFKNKKTKQFKQGIDSLQVVDEEKNNNIEIIGYEKIRNSRKKTKNKMLLKVASFVVAIFCIAFGVSYAYTGGELKDLLFANTPFEKPDYNTFGNYIYTPKENNLDIDGYKFSVLGLVLEGNTIHLSTSLSSQDKIKTPEYEVSLLINGKPMKPNGSFYGNPNASISASTSEFQLNDVDMDKKNTYEVGIRFLDEDKKGDLHFTAKLNNIDKITKIKEINKEIKQDGLTIYVEKIESNPFRTTLDIKYVIDDYSKYEKMYSESENKVKTETGKVIGIKESVEFELKNEKLESNSSVSHSEIKDNKLIVNSKLNFVSNGDKEKYDYKEILNSDLYNNIIKSNLKVGYNVYLYVNTKNASNESVLKLVKSSKEPIVVQLDKYKL